MLRTTQIKTMEQKAGRISLKVDDRPAQHLRVRNGVVSFTLSRGDHKVSEVWDQAR